jgi:hypothetical protein
MFRGGIPALGTWNAPQGHAREWRRKRHHHRRTGASASPFLRLTVLVLAAVLLVTLVWHGIRWTLHPARSPAYVYVPPVSANATAMWQREFNENLGIASDDVTAGNLSEAEVAVDRAETVITSQRLQSSSAAPDFFPAALTSLDGILAKRKPLDARLTEHVTLARISLAEFRSSLEPEPPQSSDTRRVSIGVPRELAANSVLDPATLGGLVLDASVMADTAEVLLPPSSRAFADNVRVENLIVQGAAQTLDGVRWRNVTFIDTRLRYEGGELDLENVHFVRCRFGFSTEDDDITARSTRLANAIALGKSSVSLP